MSVSRPSADRPPLVLATRNRHKLAEVTRLLAPMGLTVEPLPDGIELPPEDGDTFTANALPKARTAASATGRPAIADDSGIEAAALDGRPGSALGAVRGTRGDRRGEPAEADGRGAGGQRAALCVCARVRRSVRMARRRCSSGSAGGGWRLSVEGTRGFGYDPAFLPDDDPGGGDGDSRTMAELSEAEKDAISHRGHAIRAFAEWYLS